MSDDKSVSSVFAGFAHRTSVPTRSMDAVLTPLQEQVSPVGAWNWDTVGAVET